MERIPFNLYVYVLNAKGLEDFGRTYPENEFSKPIENAVIAHIDDASQRPLLDDVKKAIALNRQKDPKGIHFILADNYSESEQLPPTTWIILHRFLHCLFGFEDVRDIKSAVNMGKNSSYNAAVKGGSPLSPILTMQSAISDRLLRDEEGAEMATQYLLTGDVPLRNLENYFDPEGIEEIKNAVNDFKHVVDAKISDAAGKTFYI